MSAPRTFANCPGKKIHALSRPKQSLHTLTSRQRRGMPEIEAMDCNPLFFQVLLHIRSKRERLIRDVAKSALQQIIKRLAGLHTQPIRHIKSRSYYILLPVYIEVCHIEQIVSSELKTARSL